jgi:hypothetical protein
VTEPKFATHVGQFVSPTSTGDQTISGVGFTPLAVIIFATWNGSGVTGWTANTQMCEGFCATDKTQGYIATAGQDAHNPAVEERRWSSGACCGIVNYDGSLFNEAVIKSFNTDGFVLTWNTVWASAGIQYNYIAIGGSDVTNATVVSWTGQASTGTQDVTTVGFQPDLVLHLSSGSGSASPKTETYTVYMLGAMDSAGNQWCEYGEASPGTPTNTVRAQMTNCCILDTGAGTAIYNQAAYSAMLSNGFRVNWGTYGAQKKLLSLCIKGGQYLVGNYAKTTNAAPAIDSVSTTGKIAKGILFATDSYTAYNTAAVTGGRLSIGASDGTNNATCGIQNKHNVATSVAKKFEYVDKSIVICNNDTQTNDTNAKIAVFGPDTVTSTPNLNQGIATDGTNNYGWSSTVIYKYDTSWNLVTSRNIASEIGVAHMGGGDVYNGVIYIGADDRTGTTTTNARIGRWNCSDLSFVGYWDISATISGAEDCGGCAVDPVDGWIFVAPYYGSTTAIYKFALSNGAYVATITQNPALGSAQDIAYYNGRLYIMNDLSTGNRGIIVSMDLTGATQKTEVDMNAETTNQLEYEGIWVDSTGIHMLGIINPATTPAPYVFVFGNTDSFCVWYSTSSATAHQICYVLFGVTYTTASVTAVCAQATAASNGPVVSGVAGVTAVAAAATAVGNAPTLTSNNVLAAAIAQATAAGGVPAVSGAAGVTAVKAAATAAANAPTLTSNNVLAAVAAAATAAAVAPTLTSNNVLAAAIAQATAACGVPAVSGAAGVSAARAQATATANVPTLTSDNVLAAVAAAATAAAVAPTLTSNNVLAAVRAAATATANAPTLSSASVLAAVQSAATAIANAPTLSTASVLASVAATATATGCAPTLISNNVLAAVKAAATATAIAPQVSGNAAIAAVVAAATAAAIAPAVSVAMNALVNAVAATAAATAYAPTLSGDVWADVFIDAATAVAVATAIAPEITEYQGIELGAVTAAATAAAIAPELFSEIFNVPYCDPETNIDAASILINEFDGQYMDSTDLAQITQLLTELVGEYSTETDFDATMVGDVELKGTYADETEFESIVQYSTELTGFIRCKA